MGIRNALYFASAVVVAGIALTGANFNVRSPWFFLGLTSCIVGTSSAMTGIVCARSRTMDEEFEAGYRVGFRAGRRVPLASVTALPRRPDAWVSQTAEREVAGHGPPARWSQADAHRPAQRRRQGMGRGR